MNVLPSFTNNYGIVFGICFGIGCLFLISNAIQHYHYKTIKIFPKIFEMGILLINFSLLLFEVIRSPSPNWSHNWTGIIINSLLFAIVLFSLLIKKPFTIEFAKEKVPEELWNSPAFLGINIIITLVWLAEFGLSVLFGVLGVLIYPDNEIARIIPGIIVLILALIFTKKFPEYARAQAMKRLLLNHTKDDDKNNKETNEGGELEAGASKMGGNLNV